MFYGWINVVVLWIGYVLIVIPAFYGFGSMVGPLSKGLGITLTQVSIGFTMYMLSMTLSIPIVAIILNRIGVRLTIFIGAMFYVLVGLLMGYVVSSLTLYYVVVGLLMGIASSLAAPLPVMTNVSFWFVRTRATAMSLVLAGGGFGAMIFAPIIAKITANGPTWHTPWFYIALFAGIGGLVVVTFLRNKPADLGLLPDGDKPGTAEILKETKTIKKTRVYKSTHSWDARSAFKTPAIYFITLFTITVFYGVSSVMGLAVSYFTGLGIAKVVAAGAIGVYGVVSIAGRLGSGVLSDLFEPRYVAAAGFLVQVVAMVFMIIASNVTMVYLFAVFYGIAFGLTYVCLPNLIVNYYGVDNFATINGIVMMVGGALGALSPFITGLIVDATNSFTYAWIIVLVFAALSFLGALVAAPPKHQEELNAN